MNRLPSKGEVIRIKVGKNRQEHVVVRVGSEISEDRLRGDAYYADYFTTINHKDFNKPNPKMYTWTNTPTSSYTVGTGVDIKDVELLGAYKNVKELVEVTFSASGLKMFGN